MPKQISQMEIENLLRQRMDAPEPSPDLLLSLRAQFQAGTPVLQRPRPEKNNPLLVLLRTRPLVAALLALLVLLALTGVAYALSRSLGYIPGYGIVDQNVRALKLAEPVSQTRDGVVITIEDLILTPDTLYYTVSTENILNSAMLQMSDQTTPRCIGDWSYELPNGTRLTPNPNGPMGGTSDDPWWNHDDQTRTSFRTRGYFTLENAVVLEGVHELILHVPCVSGDLAAGAMPENWEFHLRLVSAPADALSKTAMPVIEYSPIPMATPVVVNPAVSTGTPQVNPITVTKVIDTGDAYVLMGELAPPPGSVSDYGSILTLRDANGKQILWDVPMEISLGTPLAQTPFAQVFAMRFNKADVSAFPLTVELTAQKWAETPIRINFDAGADPRVGQEWRIGQKFDIGNHSVTLSAIRVIAPQMASNAGALQFDLILSDAGIFVTPAVEGYPSLNEGFGGGGSSDETQALLPPQWSMNYGVEFASMPNGPMIVVLKVRVVESERTWTLPWQP